jgi:hypothetical protein
MSQYLQKSIGSYGFLQKVKGIMLGRKLAKF